MNKIIIVFSLLIAVYDLSAQMSPDQQKQVDSLFSEWNSTHSPGAVLGVVQNGELTYAKGYGMADLEHDIPLGPHSVFYAASVSKHFVTFAILLLEEEGKLDLDADIQEYLPDFPRYDAPLSIRHFIHHTSGVRDYLTLWSLAGNTYLDHIDEHEVYELIKRQKSLNFPPGDKYLYSNSCYFMLAMIVEKVSGKPIREFAKEHMFGPLGMHHTHFHDDVNFLIKNRAFSYQSNGKGSYDNLILRFDLVGSGGLYTTIEDLYLWDQNFYQNTLGKSGQQLIDKMLQDGQLNNGKSSEYAFGLVNDTYKGLKTISHGGALAGYRTHFLQFPEQNFSVFVLANISSFNAGGKAREVADILLREQMESEDSSSGTTASNQEEDSEQKQSFIALSAKDMEPFIGTYVIPNAGAWEIDIRIERDSLFAKQSWNQVEYSMSPVKKDVFMIPGNDRLSFSFTDKDGKQTNTLLVNQGGDDIVCQRKENLSQINLADFTGMYYSEELLTSYRLFLEEGQLFYQIRYQKPIAMVPVGKDLFASDNIQFTFDRKGKSVTAMRLDAGRVTDLSFVRQ